jgi:hypothetical protein
VAATKAETTAGPGLYVTQAGHHHAYADQHEADEDVELAAVEQRWHDGDSQDTGVRVVASVTRQRKR